MIQAREFRQADIYAIDPPEVHARTLEAIGDWQRMILTAAATGPTYTAEHDGKIIGIAGLGVHWAGRAEAWCLLAREVPTRAWPAIHRAVVRVLAENGYRRIEATAKTGFRQGQRWLAMLGFVPEGEMPAYGPDGADHMRWARIRR